MFGPHWAGELNTVDDIEFVGVVSPFIRIVQQEM